MTQWQMYFLSGVGVVVCALYGLFTRRQTTRQIIAVNLVGSGVFLVLISVARRGDAQSPDPVPHALVLTGIVVSISATSLALVLRKLLVQTTDERSTPLDNTPRGADEP